MSKLRGMQTAQAYVSHRSPNVFSELTVVTQSSVADCQTFRTIDYSYHRCFVPFVDFSYRGRFVPSLDFSYRSYHGLFVLSLDVSYRRGNFTYFHFLAVLEHNFSKHTVCNSRYGCELWSLDNTCIKEFDVAWRKAVRRVLKIPADTHS